MATLRLKYVHSFIDKTGRVRYYFRHSGKRWALPGVPGSTEFSLRYDQLRRECISTNSTGRQRSGLLTHTLGSVIQKWVASEDFTLIGHSTKRQYRRRAFDHIKELCGRALIADLHEEHVREIRSKFMP